MKFKLSYFVLFSIALFSCSSSDSNDPENKPPLVEDGVAKFYLPLDEGKTWTYKVQTTVPPATDPKITEDNLSTKGSIDIDGVSYKKFETTSLPNGFFSAVLNGNGAKVESNTTKVSGKLSLNLFGTVLEFPISNFIIVKKTEYEGAVLSSNSGSFNQTVSNVALKFEYTVKSIHGGSLNEYTSDGNSYTDIRKTKIVINLKVTTVTANFELIKPQDVLESTLYFSNTVGMIEGTTNIKYNLESIPGITLEIPSTGSQNQKEFLVKK